MGRHKGSLNRKTARELENITGGDKPAETQDLKNQVEQLAKCVEHLQNQLNEKQQPTYRQKLKVESQVKLEDLDKVDLLLDADVKSLENEMEVAQQELEGKRTILAEVLGGTVKTYQDQTGSDGDLHLRRFRAAKTLALQSPPNVSTTEKNKLKHEYEQLSIELRRMVPSQKAQWAVGTPEFSEAVDKQMKMGEPHWAKKIKRWKNIGKILNPDDSQMWNIDRLGKQ